jgi:hypothetical protein
LFTSVPLLNRVSFVEPTRAFGPSSGPAKFLREHRFLSPNRDILITCYGLWDREERAAHTDPEVLLAIAQLRFPDLTGRLVSSLHKNVTESLHNRQSGDGNITKWDLVGTCVSELRTY